MGIKKKKISKKEILKSKKSFKDKSIESINLNLTKGISLNIPTSIFENIVTLSSKEIKNNKDISPIEAFSLALLTTLLEECEK